MLTRTLVEIHSENKDGTTGAFQGRVRVPPLLCLLDAPGDAFSGMLRPGNATANDTADLLTVVDDAGRSFPADIAAGHRHGDDLAGVNRDVVVRSDSAGGTKAFTTGLRVRNIGFAVGAHSQDTLTAAIAVANEDPDRWEPAVDRARAQVTATTTASGQRSVRSPTWSI